MDPDHLQNLMNNIRFSSFRSWSHDVPVISLIPQGVVTIIATLALPVMSTVVNSGWGTNDRYSITGATIAGAISAIQSRTTNKVWWHTLSVLMASIFLGIILPALLIIWKYSEQWDTLTWHAWAGLGFVFGLAGWAITDFICRKVVPRTVNRLDKETRRIIGGDDTQEIK